jgi:hypothetical protein
MEMFMSLPQLCLALSTPTTPSIERGPRLLTADPNDPYQPFIEGREKLKKAIEKRQKNYSKYPARCVTIGLLVAREENPSSDAPPHSLPSVHLSESNDSKAQEELGFPQFIFLNPMIRKLRRNLALMSQNDPPRLSPKMLSTTMLA